MKFHSDLRSHRFAKQFNCLDPTCRCGIENETTDHYFLRCPYFQGPSRTFKDLLNKISEILECPVSAFPNDVLLCQLLLYGKPTLNANSNNDILCASIKFLKIPKDSKLSKLFLIQLHSCDYWYPYSLSF